MVVVHYLLHGYVCGGSCFQPSPFEGWASFTQIFQRRPDQCRYAIAQAVPLKQVDAEADGWKRVVTTGPEGDWLCWDLFDDSLVLGAPLRNRGLIAAPRPLWRAPNPDALVMKAMALYDRP